MIDFPCKPSDSLLWDLSSIPQDGPFVCRLHLGLEAPFFPLDDPMHFQALALGLKKWAEVVWPRFEQQIAGLILYKGSADFRRFFLWTPKEKENFELWLGAREGLQGVSKEHLERLFCTDAFIHYFQMLAHNLPDSAEIRLWLDATGVGSFAERHQILSKERWEHFSLVTRDLPFAIFPLWEGEAPLANHALCFPEERMCHGDVLRRLEEKMASTKGNLRVISESFLTEEWGGSRCPLCP